MIGQRAQRQLPLDALLMSDELGALAIVAALKGAQELLEDQAIRLSLPIWRRLHVSESQIGGL
jgi:hypothetical protein